MRQRALSAYESERALRDAERVADNQRLIAGFREALYERFGLDVPLDDISPDDGPRARPALVAEVDGCRFVFEAFAGGSLSVLVPCNGCGRQFLLGPTPRSIADLGAGLLQSCGRCTAGAPETQRSDFHAWVGGLTVGAMLLVPLAMAMVAMIAESSPAAAWVVSAGPFTLWCCYLFGWWPQASSSFTESSVMDWRPLLNRAVTWWPFASAAGLLLAGAFLWVQRWSLLAGNVLAAVAILVIMAVSGGQMLWACPLTTANRQRRSR